MAGLPGGWAWAELGDVADTSLGKMLDKKRSSGVYMRPYLRNVNVQWGEIRTGDMLDMDIHPDEVERFTAVKGDLLVCEGGEFGRCAIWGGNDPVAFQKALHRVRCLPALDTRFLRHYLEFAVKSGKLDRFTTGSTIKHLPQQRLREVGVPIPPLAEQHRIVEALEEQLSRLDVASLSVEQGLGKMQGFLHAVIDKELRSVSDSQRVALRDVLSEPLRNGHSAKATNDPDGVRTLSLTAVTSGDFCDANTKMTVADRDRVKDLWLEPRDLLIQRSNTPDLVGTAALFNGKRDWAIFPDLLIRVRLTSRILPEYALLELQSRRGRSYFKSRAKGLSGSMPKIDQATIEGFDLSAPEVEVQEQIVRRVMNERKRISRLTVELVKARRRAINLRNGILRKAFSGNLLPQDPSDEPAATLLTRIAAECEAAKPARRVKRAASPSKTAASRDRAVADTLAAPAPTPAPSTTVQQELFQ
ncbi:restriction endonuclease subunit S [Streptomyces sp. NPDC054784]